MKKAIVTGASGFVGTWLVKELSEHQCLVYAMVRKDEGKFDNISNVKVIECDMANIEKLADYIDGPVDAFIHLAWQGSGGDERANYEIQLNNVKLGCDAAKVAKKIGVLHFFSAGTITENIVDNIILNDKVSANMMYAVCKKTTRYMLDVYCKKIGLPFTWLQFSNVYGPYNQSGNLLSYALETLVKGEVPAFSKGEQPYDFIYVKDLVRVIRELININNKRNFYFIGSGESRKLCEYLMELPDIYGGESKVGIGLRPEDGIAYEWEWFECSELKEDIGYKAEYSFEMGIRETIEWLKKNM